MSAVPKLCYGFGGGRIYNIEAQNIVNTADLIIKAEHAHLQNSGDFTGLLNLEQSNPPYLSPMAVYNYNNDECVRKILFENNIYICVDLKSDTLNVIMPYNFAYSDIAALEISKGITGKTEQISHYNGLSYIFFDLKNNPPSFASNPDASSVAPSALSSPNANGGTSYVNTGNNSNFIGKAMQAVIGFFTAVLSLF
ncbi:MAG: hypothetical protein ACYCSQ_03150 [bacterium]